MVVEHLNETCDRKGKSGVDKYNKPEYDYYDRNIPCLLDLVTTTEIDDKGKKYTCDGTLYVEGDQEFEEDDYVDHNDGKFVVDGVDLIKDEYGDIDHKELKVRFYDD